MITEKNNIITVLKIFVESTAYPDALKRFIYNSFIHNKTTSCLSFNLYPLACLYMTNIIKKSMGHFETAFRDIDKLFNELFDKMRSGERQDCVGLEVLCDLIIYLLNNFDGDAEAIYGNSQHVIDNISICFEKLQKTIAKFLIFPEPIASRIIKIICLFEVSLAVPFSATFLNYNNRKKFINVIPKDSPLGSVLDNSNTTAMLFISSRVSRALTKSCKESLDTKGNPRAMHIQHLTTSFERNSGVSMIFYLQHEMKGFNSYFVKLLNIKDMSLLYDNEPNLFFSDSSDFIKLTSLTISLIDLNLPYDKRFTESEIEMLKDLNCNDLEFVSKSMSEEILSYYEKIQTENDFGKEKIRKLFRKYVKEAKDELITKAKSAVRLKPRDSSMLEDNEEQDKASFNEILSKIKLLPSEQKYRHFFFSDFVFNAEEPTNNKLELQIKDLYNIIKRNSVLEDSAIYLKLIITDDNHGLSALLQFYGAELSKKENMPGLAETTDSQVISEYDNSVIDLEFYSVPFRLNSIDCYIAERDKRYQFTISEPFICKTLLIPFPKIEGQVEKYNFNSFSNNSYRYDFNNKLMAAKAQQKHPKSIDIYGKPSFEPGSRTTTQYSEEGSFAFDNASILISQGNSMLKPGSVSISSAGYGDIKEGGVEKIFSARDNYPGTQYYRDNVEDYVRNASYKTGFTIFKVTGEPGDSNITIDEDGWLDNIDVDSESMEPQSIDDFENIKIKEHGSIEHSQSAHTQRITRYFIRQLIIRKKTFKKKNKVEPAICSLQIHLANEDRVIDIQELKLKYLLIYGFTITTASSNYIYKDSKAHYHNIRDLKEAHSVAEDEVFVLYLLAEASKGTSTENSEFIANHPVIYAKRLKIKCLEANGNLGLSLESVSMGSYKSLDIEPFYKKNNEKETYKLFVNRYNK
eukprot:GAHX01001265.1.p1 GENE.GAHX01001265.1~~GAHX01001265.1.p1  ORF type:complete len:1057 (-),score=220.04 GAHX01001265.1:27-2774(-)